MRAAANNTKGVIRIAANEESLRHQSRRNNEKLAAEWWKHGTARRHATGSPTLTQSRTHVSVANSLHSVIAGCALH